MVWSWFHLLGLSLLVNNKDLTPLLEKYSRSLVAVKKTPTSPPRPTLQDKSEVDHSSGFFYFFSCLN
jgi:hypothetical protein